MARTTSRVALRHFSIALGTQTPPGLDNGGARSAQCRCDLDNIGRPPTKLHNSPSDARQELIPIYARSVAIPPFQ
eukprot:7830274-Pyramimonas_sp.AAC.1